MRALAALCVSLAVGCATTKETEKSAAERLHESVEAYNHAFRWKNYERAAMFLPNKQRTMYLAAYEDDESSLQVEEFAVRNVEMVTPKEAKVLIKVTFLMLPSVMVEKKTLTQHWADVNGSWVLEHEDNSIRSLDPKKQPRDPRAIRPEDDASRSPMGDKQPPGSAGHTQVETFGPGDADDEDQPADP